MNKKHDGGPSYLEDLLLAFRRNILECTRKAGLIHDLTFSQAEALKFIGPDEKKTMKSIAEYLKISPPSATVMVSHMEKKGIVRRVKDEKDRRVVYICLTRETRKIWKAISEEKETVFAQMLSRLSAKDRKELERIIRKLITE